MNANRPAGGTRPAPSHVIITRFSFRGKDAFKHASGPTFYSNRDPLDPEGLDLRLKLLELCCLPSILGQTEQAFSWILLIDRALPAPYLTRLRALTHVRENSFIHAFDPESDLGSLDWLRPYLPHGIERIVTTNLDDDDSLPARFTAILQERLRDLDSTGQLPPIGVIGARQIVQWELLFSNDAPLGWKAPWHRPGIRVASVGLSLYCSVPAFNLCVLALKHRFAEFYFDFSTALGEANVVWIRRTASEAAQRAGIDLRTWGRDAVFYDISRDVGPVLMTNHASNDQAQRLFEAKGRTPVTGPADFPGLPIDWDKARAYASEFSRPGSDSLQPG